MPMPKTTMNKNHNLLLCDDNIGLPEKTIIIKPVSEAELENT
jgi:hypothetical protein